MELNEIVALIIGTIILVIVIAYLAINQKKNILEWLLKAVVEAEKELGSGTGQLKLRTVYDWFIEAFPVVSAFVPFSVFSAWVDVALETMEKLLKDNQQVKAYVSGEVKQLENKSN
jgi:hypothetical protein